MRTATVTTQRAEPQTGELQDFDALTARYERELLAHCYRMSGSVHEAEDLVQETFLRAWRASADFQGRSSVRTWLYRIATNVCLTNLESRPRRPLPTGLGAPDVDAADPLDAQPEVPWLEPIPDAAVQVEEKDTIRLAFVAALQHLPARQRAVLILRDVLRWSAAEVAEALETTAVAVNSALQRAHAQLDKQQLTPDGLVTDLTESQRKLLDDYVEAFWRKDIDRIVSLLTAEATWEMPPFTGWYSGSTTHRRADRHPVPRRLLRHADDRHVGQRPAGVRPLHAHARRATSCRSSCRSSSSTATGYVTSAPSTAREVFARFGLPESLPADHR